MAKSDRKKAVEDADKWFSRYIRSRDKRCVCCGSVENLQCGHLFSRIAYSTRWDETNAAAQCASCNMRTEYDSWPLTRYFLSRGADLESLHYKYSTPVKFTTAQIRAIAKEYEEKCQRQE